jgi:hypothetical protein
MEDFHGYPVKRLSSNVLELDCLATAGPRIVRLRYKGSANLLAEVPELSVPTPYGAYRSLGGHRLWFAPEAMPRTYFPDGEGLVATDLPNGVRLEGRTEAATGIHKRIDVLLQRDKAEVRLTHSLTNEGLWTVELAPWALTMFRLGGAAILPIRATNETTDDLLPNRNVVLWPYTRLHDTRLHLQDEFVVVKPRPDMRPFKIGAFSQQGWLAYWLDGVLFRKSFAVQPGLPHPDYHCNAELYCDSHFIELEGLGPLCKLEPGGSVSFEETWQLYDNLEQEFLTEEMVALCAEKGS